MHWLVSSGSLISMIPRRRLLGRSVRGCAGDRRRQLAGNLRGQLGRQQLDGERLVAAAASLSVTFSLGLEVRHGSAQAPLASATAASPRAVDAIAGLHARFSRGAAGIDVAHASRPLRPHRAQRQNAEERMLVGIELVDQLDGWLRCGPRRA